MDVGITNLFIWNDSAYFGVSVVSLKQNAKTVDGVGLGIARGTVFAAPKSRLEGVLSMDLSRVVHLHSPRKQSALGFQ